MSIHRLPRRFHGTPPVFSADNTTVRTENLASKIPVSGFLMPSVEVTGLISDVSLQMRTPGALAISWDRPVVLDAELPDARVNLGENIPNRAQELSPATQDRLGWVGIHDTELRGLGDSLGLYGPAIPAGEISITSVEMLLIAAMVSVLPSALANLHLICKRGANATFGWALASWLPLIGPLAWFALGADQHVPTTRDSGVGFLTDRYKVRRPESPVPDEFPKILKTREYFKPIVDISRHITRTPLLGGNAIKPLFNGEGAYPEMLQAIDDEPLGGFVYLGFYIFENNSWGKKFAEALRRAEDRGVNVRIITDRWGNLVGKGITDDSALKILSRKTGYRLLKEHGLDAMLFDPPAGLRNGIPWNVIYHKKVMTTSRLSFLGGINIGDTYMVSNLANPKRHQDIQYRVAGPIVPEIEESQLEDFAFVTGETKGMRHANGAQVGEVYARLIRSGPDDNFANFKKIALAAIDHAGDHVKLLTGYFAPDRDLINALKAAATRRKISGDGNVDVELILSEASFVPPFDWASRTFFEELVRAGVKIYYQPPPFDHTKLLEIDDFYSISGSSNLDHRSMKIHVELNLEVYDETLASGLRTRFDAIREKSKPITIEMIAEWSWYERFRNRLYQQAAFFY